LTKIKAVKLVDLHRIAQEVIKSDQLRLAMIGPFKHQAEVEKWLAAALAQKSTK
jgi:predicted Zn-dependent peptidase